MSSFDYIPRQEYKLLDWAKKLAGYATSHCINWKIEAPGAKMSTCINNYETAFMKVISPNRGKVDTLEKNEAKKALIKECRTYTQGFLAKNPYVTDADRKEMGITVRDTTPTSVPDPNGQAVADISYPGRTQLQLRAKHIEGTPENAKANYGYRIFSGIYASGDALPSSGKDLHESKFTRKKKTIYTFEPEDSGKKAFFCIRYENSKGKTGPWGPLFWAIIP